LERIDMERTRKPTAAGILCIIEGVIVVVILGMFVALSIGPAFTSDEPILLIILIFFGIPSIPFGILAIVGDVYALRRRRWALALAGSICALIFGIIANYIVLGMTGAWLSLVPSSDLLAVLPSVVFGLLGLLALIFVILGTREFK
jgi:hypothetical protein